MNDFKFAYELNDATLKVEPAYSSGKGIVVMYSKNGIDIPLLRVESSTETNAYFYTDRNEEDYTYKTCLSSLSSPRKDFTSILEKGTKVRVKDDLIVNKQYEDEHSGRTETFVEGMEPLVGEIVTILRYSNGLYSIEEKGYNWTSTMFEYIVDEELKSNDNPLKVGDKVTFREDLQTSKLYGEIKLLPGMKDTIDDFNRSGKDFTVKATEGNMFTVEEYFIEFWYDYTMLQTVNGKAIYVPEETEDVKTKVVNKVDVKIKVGDKVTFRKDLIKSKEYGKITLLSPMKKCIDNINGKFTDTTVLSTVDDYFTVENGNQFLYDREMLQSINGVDITSSSTDITKISGKYKKGDYVKLKKGLVPYKNYGSKYDDSSVTFTPYMNHFVENAVKIEKVEPSGSYCIVEEGIGRTWYISDDMIDGLYKIAKIED